MACPTGNRFAVTMDTIPAALCEAYRLLRIELYRHLDEAEFLATKYQPWSGTDATSARALIPDLVVVIRGVLVQHEESRQGHCRCCTEQWPCPTVQTIHRLLKDPDREFTRLLQQNGEP